MDREQIVDELISCGAYAPELKPALDDAPTAVLVQMHVNSCPETIEDAVAAIPEQFRADVEAGLKLNTAKQEADEQAKKELVAQLKTNTKLTEEQLNAMDVGALTAIRDSVGKADFSAAAGAGTSTEVKINKDVTLPVMPTVPTSASK